MEVEVLDDVLSGGDPAEFGAIAAALLLQTDLVVAGRRHAILELEFYASSPSHPDPFAHGEAPQRTNGRWYFHRRSGSYRGGSFKGLDVTFGPVGDVGGILIRTLEAPDGARINGPSLCVDHLLERTGAASVAALDEELGASKVWAARGPLRLAWRARPRDDEVVSTARVGLTLKRAADHPEMPAYLMRRYRFTTDPTIPKGRPHTILALHQDGADADTIARRTGSRAHTVRAYTSAHDEAASRSVEEWVGEPLTTRDVCALHGAWWARWGSG